MKKVISFLLLMFILANNVAFASDDSEWADFVKMQIQQDEKFDTRWYAEDYLRAFHPDVWIKSFRDEFALQEHRAMAEAEMNAIRNTPFKPSNHSMYIRVRVSEYDFKDHSFPIKCDDFGGLVVEFRRKANETNGRLPGRYYVMFNNYKNFGKLPMAKDKARAFNTRLIQSGRHMYAKISYTVTGYAGMQGRKHVFKGGVTGLELYENDTFSNIVTAVNEISYEPPAPTRILEKPDWHSGTIKGVMSVGVTIKFTDYDEQAGTFKGEMDIFQRRTRVRIEGVVKGKALVFKDVSYIQKGRWQLGNEYVFDAADEYEVKGRVGQTRMTINFMVASPPR